MEGLRKYLRIALPLLFISYLGCLIAFTHVHIVNGVTIVHSHPYQKNDDGTPKKEHNYAEFQLLHQLSTIQISGATFAQVLIAAFLATFCVLSTCPVYPDHLRPVQGRFRFVRHHLSFLIINDGTKIYLSLHLAARP